MKGGNRRIKLVILEHFSNFFNITTRLRHCYSQQPLKSVAVLKLA